MTKECHPTVAKTLKKTTFNGGCVLTYDRLCLNGNTNHEQPDKKGTPYDKGQIILSLSNPGQDSNLAVYVNLMQPGRVILDVYQHKTQLANVDVSLLPEHRSSLIHDLFIAQEPLFPVLKKTLQLPPLFRDLAARFDKVTRKTPIAVQVAGKRNYPDNHIITDDIYCPLLPEGAGKASPPTNPNGIDLKHVGFTRTVRHLSFDPTQQVMRGCNIVQTVIPYSILSTHNIEGYLRVTIRNGRHGGERTVEANLSPAQMNKLSRRIQITRFGHPKTTAGHLQVVANSIHVPKAQKNVYPLHPSTKQQGLPLQVMAPPLIYA